jgi:hypothetical protein
MRFNVSATASHTLSKTPNLKLSNLKQILRSQSGDIRTGANIHNSVICTHAVLLTTLLQAPRVLPQPPALLRVPQSCRERPWRQSGCSKQVLCLESRAESPVKAEAGGMSHACTPSHVNMCFASSHTFALQHITEMLRGRL